MRAYILALFSIIEESFHSFILSLLSIIFSVGYLQMLFIKLRKYPDHCLVYKGKLHNLPAQGAQRLMEETNANR